MFPVTGIWSFSLHVDFEEEECNLITNKEECGMVFYDEDADIDESEDSIDSPTVQQVRSHLTVLKLFYNYKKNCGHVMVWHCCCPCFYPPYHL